MSCNFSFIRINRCIICAKFEIIICRLLLLDKQIICLYRGLLLGAVIFSSLMDVDGVLILVDFQ